VLVKFVFGSSFRRDYIPNGIQDGTCPVKGLNRIDGAILRVGKGPVFGPAALELSELPGADSSRPQRSVLLDIHRLMLFFSHTLTDRFEGHS
jgi:hypothetical protein